MGPELCKQLPVIPGLKFEYAEMGMAWFGMAFSMAHNYSKRRPFAAAIPQHIACVVAGYFAGKYLVKYLEDKRNMKVTILEDYISKHPEDFPLVEAPKFKDVLYGWRPNR